MRRAWTAGAAGVLVAAMVALAGCGPRDDGTTARVVIPRGASFRTAADSLAAAGVIGTPRLFAWYAARAGRDRAIKPGTYALGRGLPWRTLIDALETGRGLTRTVVVPEGLALRELAPLLARALDVPEDSVHAAARDSAWRARLQVPTPSLEGYLFPATYAFAEGTSARAAVHAMLERFEQAWRPAWDTALAARGRSRHEAVTMASIVEKEARVATERPVIAAVYWNRVRRRMRLQADPTVQYALPAPVSRVLYRHLQVDSPYNTYRREGLPPGPIAAPGAASLEAAVLPADAPFLFFVAHPDGHHEFRTTFAEHRQAIVQVRREAARREDTRRAAARRDSMAAVAARRAGGAAAARR